MKKGKDIVIGKVHLYYGGIAYNFALALGIIIAGAAFIAIAAGGMALLDSVGMYNGFTWTW